MLFLVPPELRGNPSTAQIAAIQLLFRARNARVCCIRHSPSSVTARVVHPVSQCAPLLIPPISQYPPGSVPSVPVNIVSGLAKPHSSCFPGSSWFRSSSIPGFHRPCSSSIPEFRRSQSPDELLFPVLCEKLLLSPPPPTPRCPGPARTSGFSAAALTHPALTFCPHSLTHSLTHSGCWRFSTGCWIGSSLCSGRRRWS